MPANTTRRDPDLGEKIVFLGAMGVGKSSLVYRMIRNAFPDPCSGRSASFLVHKMTVDGRVVKLELWDTAGQERFRSLAPMYYKGASGAVVVFDVSDASSFEVAQRWIDELKTRALPNCQIFLVGNKIDLTERAVDPDRIKEFSQSVGIRYFETSAKTGEGAKEALEAIVRSIIVFKENDNSNEEEPIRPLPRTGKKTERCLIN